MACSLARKLFSRDGQRKGWERWENGEGIGPEGGGVGTKEEEEEEERGGEGDGMAEGGELI